MSYFRKLKRNVLDSIISSLTKVRDAEKKNKRRTKIKKKVGRTKTKVQSKKAKNNLENELDGICKEGNEAL